jgi:hypothetical protein
LKKLIVTAFVLMLIILISGYAIYVMAQDTTEKQAKSCCNQEAQSEKSDMKAEGKPRPMQGKMMQQMKDMEGQMNMGEGKMCPMHEKMMQQMKNMGDKPMMQDQMCPMCKMMIGECKMCPMHEKMMQQMKNMGDKPMMQGQGIGMMGIPVMRDMIFKLDLSKSQQEFLNNTFDAHKREMGRLMAEREDIAEELNKVSKQQEISLRQVRELVQKAANLDADMKYSQFKVMVDAKSILAPEQRANLRKMMENKPNPHEMPAKEQKPEKTEHDQHQ